MMLLAPVTQADPRCWVTNNEIPAPERGYDGSGGEDSTLVEHSGGHCRSFQRFSYAAAFDDLDPLRESDEQG